MIGIFRITMRKHELPNRSASARPRVYEAGPRENRFWGLQPFPTGTWLTDGAKTCGMNTMSHDSIGGL